MTRSKLSVLVIVPCYNEEKSILGVAKELEKLGWNYIVVNDGSTDGSLQILRDNGVNHLNLINNLGIGGAVQAGYRYAAALGYDIAVQFDGDGQHDAAYIEKIIEPIVKQEANLIIGSRFVGNESEFKSTKTRQLGIRLLAGFFKASTHQEIRDMTSGFRAVDRGVIERFAMKYPSEYPEPVTNLILAKSGGTLKEVAVKMRERAYGTSSISMLKSFYYMLNVFFLFVIVLLNKGDDVNV